MEVITNWNRRHFIYRHDLPAKYEAMIEGDYSHLDDDDTLDNWIIYRGSLYHISDFLVWNTMWTGSSPYDPYWHGHNADSFFSCVLIHLCVDDEDSDDEDSDDESYVIALALS